MKRKILGLFLVIGIIFVAFVAANDYVKKTTKFFKVAKVILIKNEDLIVTVWFPPLEKLKTEDGVIYGFEYSFHVEIDMALVSENRNLVEPGFFISQGNREYPMSLKIENTFYTDRIDRKPSIVRQGFIVFSRPDPLVPGNNEPLIDFLEKFTLRCGKNSITIKTKPFRDFPSFIW